MRIHKKYIAGLSWTWPWTSVRSFLGRIHIYFANWRDQSRGGVDLRHALYHLGITKQGGCKGRGEWHAPTSSLFLTALSHEYPLESTLCLRLLRLSVPYPLAAPSTRVVTLSEYRNYPTARFRRLGGRRHFATYFACPLTRVWSKIAGSFPLSVEKSTARRKMREQSRLECKSIDNSVSIILAVLESLFCTNTGARTIEAFDNGVIILLTPKSLHCTIHSTILRIFS